MHWLGDWPFKQRCALGFGPQYWIRRGVPSADEECPAEAQVSEPSGVCRLHTCWKTAPAPGVFLASHAPTEACATNALARLALLPGKTSAPDILATSRAKVCNTPCAYDYDRLDDATLYTMYILSHDTRCYQHYASVTSEAQWRAALQVAILSGASLAELKRIVPGSCEMLLQL